MFLGRPGTKFNGGCTLLRQSIVGEEMHDDGAFTVKLVVLALTGEHAVDPYVTWNRWVTFEADRRIVRADSCDTGHYFHVLDERTLADFDERVEKITHARENEKAIRGRGEEDGKNAASWLIDGNTQDPFAVLDRIKNGIEDGDPAILDALPKPRVGGEFADDPTWEDICMAEIERYENGEDELYDVYIEAFDDGVHNEIVRMWDNYRPDWSVKS